MPAFKELDPELVRKVLEGQVDVLTPLIKKEETFLKNFACLLCGSTNHETFVNPSRPFTEGSPISNKLLRCLQCNGEFDPYTHLVTKVIDESV